MADRRYADPRYKTRLRSHGFGKNDPIDLDKLFYGGYLGVWDTIEERWVKHTPLGEWIPEDD
jgi:hypothetical protein